MRDDVYGFIVIFIRKDLVFLEDEAIKHKIFSTLKCRCIIFLKLIWNLYISRPTRCTNSYNESLLIVKRSTCFGLLSPSSGATFWSRISQLV